MKNTIIILALALLSVLQVQAQFLIGSPDRTLLRNTREWTVEKDLHGEMFVRAGMIALNRTSANDPSIQNALSTQEMLSIRLFDNLTITARKTRLRITPYGGIYWTGKIENSSDGELTLFMQNNYLTGSVHLDNEVYDITADGPETVRVVELDLLNNPSPEEDCFYQDPDEQDDFFDEIASPASDTPLRASATVDGDGYYIIDILVLYADWVRQALGYTPEARTAKVNEFIEQTNEIFENSEIKIRFRLVHDEVNEDIPADATLASQVRGAPNISTMRDQYGADIVSHWNRNGAAGNGYIYSGNARNSGYNTCRYAEVVGQYTFAHECGHNLGAHHDRYEFRDSLSVLKTRPYYQFGKCFSNYRTVMAYGNCSSSGGTTGGSCARIKHFSNPNVLYNGVPTGVAGTTASEMLDGGPANNALRLNTTASVVSACNDPVSAPPTFNLTVNNGTPALSSVVVHTVIIITADAAPAGQKFSHWSWGTAGGTIIDNVNSATTRVTMLSKDVTIRANYTSLTGAIVPDDAVIAVKYYNLQGIETLPATSGIYIVKNRYASGKTTVSKVFVEKP